MVAQRQKELQYIKRPKNTYIATVKHEPLHVKHFKQWHDYAEPQVKRDFDGSIHVFDTLQECEAYYIVTSKLKNGGYPGIRFRLRKGSARIQVSAMGMIQVRILDSRQMTGHKVAFGCQRTQLLSKMRTEKKGFGVACSASLLILILSSLLASCKRRADRHACGDSPATNERVSLWSSPLGTESQIHRALALFEDSGRFQYWESSDVHTTTGTAYPIGGVYEIHGERVILKGFLDTEVALTMESRSNVSMLVYTDGSRSQRDEWVLLKRDHEDIRNPFGILEPTPFDNDMPEGKR